MRAEVTKHVLPGRKSLSCPAAICSGRSDLGDEQTQRLEHNGMSANLETSPRKIAFVEHAGSRPKKGLGKAVDIGEETGKGTRWDRRGWGPGIWGKICGDNIGNIPLAAGAEWQPAQTPETRL